MDAKGCTVRLGNLVSAVGIGSYLGVALGCERPVPSSVPSPDIPAQARARAPKVDQGLLRAAENSKPALVRELATLVNIDSGTDDASGLLRVSELLSRRLKELG